MKQIKNLIALMLAMLLVFSLAGCAAPKQNQPAETTAAVSETEAETTAAAEQTAPAGEAEDESDNDLIILYTNDTHGYINNFTKTDENGNPGLSFASVAAMKQELLDQGENVILVDAGDHIQGTVYNSVDQGRRIIYLMNMAGYDAATLGNHEFDYNCFRMFSATAKAWYPYISCNLYELEDGLPLFPAYTTFETKSGKTVALIGLGTPESFLTPVRFEDDKGNAYLDFYGRQDVNDLYAVVQSTIDLAKYDGADYIIGLGHLGVDTSSYGYRSVDVISHVRGFDAFIDGHSHTTMEKEMVKDASGKEIPLTQSACYFGAFGKLTLKKDGTIDTELITNYDKFDPIVRKLEQNWINTVELQMQDKIASTDNTLWINNASNPEERLIRRQETNLGDMCADAIYSFYNIDKSMNCDIAVVNGGGIRTDIPAGDITYLSCKAVHPFGNVACLVGLTGQQILDMLEWATWPVGLIDPVTDKPAETGSFLHCAGLRYTIDTTIADTMIRDENGVWAGPPTGEYRVRDVSVYDKTTGQYEPLDLDRIYCVGGQNYLLRSLGEGLNMLEKSQLIEDFSGEDYTIFAKYLSNFAQDENGEKKITTAGSPLSKYTGYDLDYENPLGSGRIKIILE